MVGQRVRVGRIHLPSPEKLLQKLCSGEEVERSTAVRTLTEPLYEGAGQPPHPKGGQQRQLLIVTTVGERPAVSPRAHVETAWLVRLLPNCAKLAARQRPRPAPASSEWGGDPRQGLRREGTYCARVPANAFRLEIRSWRHASSVLVPACCAQCSRHWEEPLARTRPKRAGALQPAQTPPHSRYYARQQGQCRVLLRAAHVPGAP